MTYVIRIKDGHHVVDMTIISKIRIPDGRHFPDMTYLKKWMTKEELEEFEKLNSRRTNHEITINRTGH